MGYGFLLATVGGAVALLASCALFPSVMECSNPEVIYRVRDSKRTLYLTLDDGPSAATKTILGVLRKHEVKATFFVVADHLTPSISRQIVEEGHQLGHHMKTTRKTGDMSDEEFQREFVEAEEAIRAYSSTRLFRPPGGSLRRSQMRFVTSRGYAVVVGTVYPLDHLLESESGIATLAKVLVVDGGIIILHDTATRGVRTAAVLERLLPDLMRRGYSFELLPGKLPGPVTKN